jgi:hypothetical protein
MTHEISQAAAREVLAYIRKSAIELQQAGESYETSLTSTLHRVIGMLSFFAGWTEKELQAFKLVAPAGQKEVSELANGKDPT